MPQGPPWLSWTSWQLWHTSQNKWNLLNLAFDILVAAAIVLVPTALWELRRRRNIFQLRLSDFFIAITALALFLTWLMHHWKGYSEYEELQAIEVASDDDMLWDDLEDLRPKWLVRLIGWGSVPDCFIRFKSLYFYPDSGNIDNLESLVPRLSQFEYLRTIYVFCDSEPLAFRMRAAIHAVLPACEIVLPDFQGPHQQSEPQDAIEESVENPFE